VHLSADHYCVSGTIHRTVDLDQGESEWVAERDQFCGALRRLDSSKFGGAQNGTFRCLPALYEMKYFRRDAHTTHGNGAPISNWFCANINHRRATIRANMRESQLFHGLILAVWRGDATRRAR
jgi:hypothetical protein